MQGFITRSVLVITMITLITLISGTGVESASIFRSSSGSRERRQVSWHALNNPEGCCADSVGDPIDTLAVDPATSVSRCKAACENRMDCGAFNMVAERRADDLTRWKQGVCNLLPWTSEAVSTYPYSDPLNERIGCRCFKISSDPPSTAPPDRTTASSCPEVDPSAPPNVLILLADDMGYGDLGAYGSPYARTPNIDRLAAEGTMYMRAYANGLTCSPSRVSMMSGRFPRNINQQTNFVYQVGFDSLGIVPFTARLSQFGFTTYHTGKWHIGPEEINGTYGIDGVFTNTGKQPDSGTSRDDRMYGVVEDILAECKAGGSPCFINAWGAVPHYQVEPTEAALAQFDDLTIDETLLSQSVLDKIGLCGPVVSDPAQNEVKMYLAEVWGLDQAIGRTLAKLDELCMRDNTLVIFTSDHGADDVSSATGVDPIRCKMMGSSGPLQGGKHSLYEGGIRVPFIVRWPGHVQAGRVDGSSVIALLDIAGTVLKAAGATMDLITEAQVEGRPIPLTDDDMASNDERPRLFWNKGQANVAVIDGEWKLWLFQGNVVALYNVDSDPGESTDVQTVYPAITVTLRQAALDWVSRWPDVPSWVPSAPSESSTAQPASQTTVSLSPIWSGRWQRLRTPDGCCSGTNGAISEVQISVPGGTSVKTCKAVCAADTSCAGFNMIGTSSCNFLAWLPEITSTNGESSCRCYKKTL